MAQFLKLKTAPGIALFVAAFLALVIANSPLSQYYFMFKEIPVVFRAGNFVINKPLLLWINDGLMAVFFLLVGLEIKRELTEGHLSSVQKALLPMIAAVGGMIVPALIYTYINVDPVAHRGWAIPAATDIAFALGVALMLGKRVPESLKICLVAIAIIDDLLAIVIIAVFYTDHLSLYLLFWAFAGLAIAAFMSVRKVTALSPYVVVGLFIWACVLKSGVHATLAGVALGLTIPLKSKNRQGRSPLKVMEHALQPWVSFFILPVFAFANAGVSLRGITLETLMQPITLGIALGLFLGKQIGVFLATYLACTLNVCKLPAGVTWLQYYGMALLTGIGFTMSLFIGTLAFSDIGFAVPVRLGVLAGSVASALAGAMVLALTARQKA